MATQHESASVVSNANPPLMQELGMKERFYRYFQEEVTALQEQIEQLVQFALVAGERQDAIDHCLAGIARLSSEVSDASDYLPAYDQRTYSQAIKALSEKLQETRAKFAPKSRFAFKTQHKNGSAISLNDATELAQDKSLGLVNNNQGFDSSPESSIATTSAQSKTTSSETDMVGELPAFSKNYNEEIAKHPGGPIRKPSFSQASNVTISDHTGLHIILPSSASHATSSGSLTNLNKCIVDMSIPTTHGASFAGLMLKNIKSSLIITGQIAGAAHITGVENSIIAVSSRQVRMHDCKNVDIYLMCSSRPIIEDCSGVRFAPIPECYLSKPQTETQTVARNHWDQVDDFKWLKAEHSPNWRILPEEDRLQDETWTTTVPGGQGMGLDDIMKKVGIEVSNGAEAFSSIA